MSDSEGFSGNERKTRKQFIWQIPLLLFLIIGTIFIVRQQRSMPYQTDKGFVFGTMYNITYQHEENLQAEIESELKSIDDIFSMFNEKSLVTSFNKGHSLKLEGHLLQLYQLSCRVHEDTEGAFDITVAPLVNAWGFGFKNEKMPNEHQIDSLLSFVGMNRLHFDEKTSVLSKKDARTMLDFSAVAKGFGCDCIATLLRKHGIKNFMVEIGGEVVTLGVSPNRVPWRIGVTKPTDDSLRTEESLQTVLNVTDRAMATSGNYRNFYYNNGQKYAHTIDPRTGIPVQHNILSATVLAKNCATADAYATSFMVLGLERAQKLLERHPELLAYLIYTDADGNYAVWCSPDLRESIKD